jgi:hypothetical protein
MSALNYEHLAQYLERNGEFNTNRELRMSYGVQFITVNVYGSTATVLLEHSTNKYRLYHGPNTAIPPIDPPEDNRAVFQTGSNTMTRWPTLRNA